MKNIKNMKKAKKHDSLSQTTISENNSNSTIVDSKSIDDETDSFYNTFSEISDVGLEELIHEKELEVHEIENISEFNKYIHNTKTLLLKRCKIPSKANKIIYGGNIKNKLAVKKKKEKIKINLDDDNSVFHKIIDLFKIPKMKIKHVENTEDPKEDFVEVNLNLNNDEIPGIVVTMKKSRFEFFKKIFLSSIWVIIYFLKEKLINNCQNSLKIIIIAFQGTFFASEEGGLDLTNRENESLDVTDRQNKGLTAENLSLILAYILIIIIFICSITYFLYVIITMSRNLADNENKLI